MKRNPIVRGLLLCAAAGAAPGPAAASISGFVSGQVGVPGPDPDLHESASSDQPAYFIDVGVLNSIGGDGLGIQGIDFRGGMFVGRAHSCVGPPVPFRDQAFGSSDLSITGETFRVISDAQPAPQIAQVTFCYSYTSIVQGSTVVPSLTDTSNAGTQVYVRVNNQTLLNASHQVNSRTGVITASGALEGMTDNTATVEGTFTISVQVGVSFPLQLNLSAGSEATSRSAAGMFPDVESTSGFALTFGAHTAAGLHVEWRGEAWAGLCGSSVDLVPPNPADEPAPSTSIALCFAGALMNGKRRRR
ncbi:MAG TPA: hypothetical protein VG797_09555 [Phycisphaerales bacterium]|nr:hypothetical protein [Phycisphaerales bacterium]